MGILSLTSFVDENQQLLTDLRLHDTRVVIDGNNLYHFCYSYFNFQHQHGGDYDAFADKIRYYFSAFKSCRIEPFVVFDGGYDEDDRKLSTTVKRAKDRLHSACLLSSGKQRVIVCPILAFETFVNVLDELRIRHVTCDFEADSKTAALAVEWNCPVMSNDSDFFIYDVRGGFILFDYLSLVVKEHKSESEGQESYRYLDAQVYYVDNLLSYVPGMDRSCMSLFATLMGTDYVNADEFATFFANHSFPRASSKRFRTSKRHERMLSLLAWLESAGRLEDAVQSLLSHIKKESRGKVEKLVRMSVSSYLDLKSTLSEYFTSNESTMSLESEVKSKEKHPLPGWLVKEVRCARIPVTALNTLVHRRNMLLAQIELMAEESAYNCARSLRQVFYGILLSLDTSSSASVVNEYTRRMKQLGKFAVDTTVTLADGSSIPSLLEIPNMAENDRAQFLLKCLGGHDFQTLHVDDCYLLALQIIPYWIINSVPKINVLYLYAIIVSFIKVSILDKKHGLEIRNKDGSKTLKETCDAKTRRTARENLEKVCQREASHALDTQCMHAYSQYQACFKACTYLNGLLLQPLSQAHPEKILNGTCFYCITKELKLRKCPTLYVEELLVRGSKLAALFNQLLTGVLNVVPEESLAYPEEGTKNTKRKTKVSRKAVKKAMPASDEEDEDTKQEHHEKISAACALGNRFALLELAGAE